MSWLWLLLAIGTEVAGTLSLRASEGLRRKRWYAPIAVAYALSFYLLALSLNAGMHVAVAYGIWSALGITVIALLARVIWYEPLTRRMVLGMGFVVLGVILINLQ